VPARLKVFAARLGFFDTAVAAPSQKAALAAWGVHQDLFKDGAAAVTDDPAAQAALDRPGVVLRRMAGSTGPYEETPTVSGEGLIPAASKPAGKRAAPPPKPKPPPDRSVLTAAEKALAEEERARTAALNELEDRRRALEQEAERVAADHARRLERLTFALRKAEADYRRAGGT
jgi:hypothetical protein